MNHRYPTLLKLNESVASVISETALSIERFESTLLTPTDAINVALYVTLADVDTYFSSNDYSCLKRCYSRLGAFSTVFPETYSFQLMRFVVAANLGKIMIKKSFLLTCLGIFLPDIFDQLEIKCLQLDTLGYLITELAPLFADFDSIKSICKSAQSLYESNNRDTWNLISQSLDNGSIISVLDFCEFSARLERSLQSVAFDVANVKSLIMKTPLSSLAKDSATVSTLDRLRKAMSQELVDNRDFKVFNSIDACGNMLEFVKRFTFFEKEHVKSLIYLFDNSSYSAIGEHLSTEAAVERFNAELADACSSLKNRPFSFEAVNFIGSSLQRIRELHFALQSNGRPYSGLKLSFNIIAGFISYFLDSDSSDLLVEQRVTLNRFSEYIKVHNLIQ